MPNFFAMGGLVMWPLLLFSLVTTALIFERCWFWIRLWRRQQALARSVLETYEKKPEVALKKLQQQQDLPLARIFLAALNLEAATADEFRLALESAAQAELPLLKRFQTVFETVIGVAPLLGLLGTILGLIRVLSSLRLGDAVTEGSANVTLGIGEALISTAAGLIVAIVTLLFANLFQGLYRRQRAFIESTGGQLELMYRRQLKHPLDRQPVDRPSL